MRYLLVVVAFINGEEIVIERSIHWNCKEYVKIVNEEEYNIKPKLEFFCYDTKKKKMGKQKIP